jgi:hypothetical protein
MEWEELGEDGFEGSVGFHSFIYIWWSSRASALSRPYRDQRSSVNISALQYNAISQDAHAR